MPRPIYQYRPVNNKDQAIGVRLPFNKGAAGRPASSNYASGSVSGNGVFVSSYTTQEAAISNLKNLILTEKGDRYMQPNLGTNIRTILFENNVNDIRDLLKDSLIADLKLWLPYISLQDIEVAPSDDFHSLTIRMNFAVTNIGANVVINILASENEFVVEEETTDVLTQVSSFGADTAFGLGTTGTY